MPDIIIHNETTYDLAPWILASIKAESIEYFGEVITSIRVQRGSYRHGFNVKTGEVRYAFFPEDFDLESSTALSDAAALADMVSLSIPDLSLLRTEDSFEEGDDVEMDFDLIDDIPVGEFESIDPDFDAMDDSDAVVIGDDQDEFD